MSSSAPQRTTVGRDLVRRWRAGLPPATPGAGPFFGPVPVSAVQRGILVFERVRPGTAVFNLSFAARHSGPLDSARLDGALTALVRRHAVLRSTFAEGLDGLECTIARPAELAVAWTDLRHLPAEIRDGVAQARAERAAAEPFDLERGPLIRVHGYTVGEEERLLAFTAHHLVCDGPSIATLLHELDAAYAGTLPIDEAPFVAPASATSATLAHWHERLAALPDLDLPTERTGPTDADFRARSVHLEVSAEVLAAADRLASSERASTFMAVLAAFQLLLGEQSGQSDFAVGTPHAGRSGPGEGAAVGLLSDLLVLRTDLGGRPTFRELVRRARATCLDAFAHRAVAFEDLVAALAPGRNAAGSLVRATLAYHGERAPAMLAGSPLVTAPLSRPAVRHEIELHLWREDGRLSGRWDCRADAFSMASARLMAERLPVLLARLLAEPDRPVHELDLLTDTERTHLDAWCAGPLPPLPDVSVLALVEAQARRTPDAVAVRDVRRELTYRGLDERANQLGHHLRANGTRPGDVIGIRLPRSADLVVAMLGVLKAGATYLPLDPVYPDERIDFMLRDSGAGMVIGDAEVRAAAAAPTTTPGITIDPAQTAWILYTSGTTGRPKGVLVTHRNAVAMMRWGADEFTPAQLSRVLFSTSACFDVSAFEIYVPLCSGGAVVVVENALALLAETPDVTMICSIPSAVRELLDAGALPRSVLALGLGGEAVTGTIADDLYATGHVEVVADLYGPTEDTTYSTHARLRPGEHPAPIGEVMPHGRGYVLDPGLRRVPVGAVGELYLAGRGLTTGYLGQPGLTAGRYVADPYAAVPGARMYRTGDLVRHRPEGALLYLGRRDFQVKVRGARIELGEVEGALLRHPDVARAVVVLTGERLTAYVTSHPDRALDLDDLRAFVRNSLPSVMVPSSTVLLDTMPLTPNGKIDRSALPEPEVRASTGRGRPHGRAEELVAAVWGEVLGRDDVAREDDFFDLGGDSLLAGKVLAALRRATGADLGLPLIFEHTRLADLAASLGDPSLDSHGAAVVPLRAPDAAPVLSFEQQRVWLEGMLKPSTAYNVHGRWLLRGPLDANLLSRCVRAIVGRHEALRTTFPMVDGLPVQHVADDIGDVVQVDDTTQEDDPGAAAAVLADARAVSAFDLVNGPLCDCLLVRQGDGEHLLAVTIHHLVSDGWSIGVFARELSALYAVGGAADAPGLAPLPVQYLDYAVWQRARLTGPRLEKQLAAWRGLLDGAPAAINLPTRRRGAPGQGAAGGRVNVSVDDATADALQRVAREHDATPFMAILAALAVVLRRWSGQDDLVVGVPVNTRAQSGIDAVIGFFVNTVPIRVRVDRDPSYADLLRSVRTACLAAYGALGETPFDVLVRELRPVRDPLRGPFFQVQMSMIDTADGDWRLPGIDVEHSVLPPQPAKTDLSLDVFHHAGRYRLDLSYAAGLLDAPTAQALADQVASVLAAAVAEPSAGVLGHRAGEVVTPRIRRRVAPSDDLVLAIPIDMSAEQAALAASLAGASDVVVADPAVCDPGRLSSWLHANGVTTVLLTPALLRSLTFAARPATLPLSCVLVTNDGELAGLDIDRLRNLAPGCRILAVCHSAADASPRAVYDVPADWRAADAPLRVPIGTPLEPAVLRGRSGAPAVVGEVSRWEALPGHDVRLRHDGLLEFVPPLADPFETVASLLEVPGVQDAVVGEGEGGLFACVADPTSTADLDRARQHLVTRLPEHLVPVRIDRCGRLPLTTDGRHALRALLPQSHGSGSRR